ncbi:MAG: complex I subunit 5 family protein [Elusimicrobiota bacterium]
MEVFQLTIIIPVVLGVAVLFLPRSFFKYGGIFAACASIAVLAGGIIALPEYRFSFDGGTVFMQAGTLPLALVVLTGFFGLLISLYSVGHMKDGSGVFWALFCMVLASSAGVFLAAKYIVLLVCWGLTGILLALMIFYSGKEEIGKKTFIIIGGTDALMLLGLVGMVFLSKTDCLAGTGIKLGGPFSWMIFLSLLSAAFAKAGAIPFHTWIPDVSKQCPVPIVALLPASLDKLLGIYLLKKIVIDWFEVSSAGNTFLLAIGAITIIVAVFMALSQHDLKRLLGYHAVSQVGYMVMGIGTGNIIGIAGGLLHMVNHAIYKQGLFLCSGIIEKETGTTKLEDMGGLAKGFPLTFASFMICALSISGFPLFNGFISKWLVYRGVIETGKTIGPLWVIWLVAAIFGSVLTLASFVKVIHAVFLGQSTSDKIPCREKLSWELPALIILPLLCIAIGLFPQYTVYPVLNSILGQLPLQIIEAWQPHLAGILIMLGISFGFLVYIITNVGGYRISGTYIGGEKITPRMRVSGVEFYTTIENLGIFRKIYKLAKQGYFDLYEVTKAFIFYWINLFRWLHNGILSVYILWVMVGSVILFYVILK